MKRFKLVVPSFVALIFCALLMLGSTLALFTSKAEASISVTSGKVDVDASLTNLKLFSADPSMTSGTQAGVISDGDHAGTYYYNDRTEAGSFLNSGTAVISNGNELVINKMTPGDKVTLKLDAENNSNVNIKYRLSFNATTESDQDLLSVLLINFKNTDFGNKEFEGLKNFKSAWIEKLATAKDISDTEIEIIFPLSVESSEENNFKYENKTVAFEITLLAVQGNGATSGVETSEMVAKTVEVYENLPVVQQTAETQVNPDTQEVEVVDTTVSTQSEEAGIEVSVVVPANLTKENQAQVSTTSTVALEVKDVALTTDNETAKETVELDIELKIDGNKVENVDQPITVTLNVGTGKNITSFKHNGQEIAFNYSAQTGILTFQTTSFSPFEYTYEIEPIAVQLIHGEEVTNYYAVDYQTSALMWEKVLENAEADDLVKLFTKYGNSEYKVSRIIVVNTPAELRAAVSTVNNDSTKDVVIVGSSMTANEALDGNSMCISNGLYFTSDIILEGNGNELRSSWALFRYSYATNNCKVTFRHLNLYSYAYIINFDGGNGSFFVEDSEISGWTSYGSIASAVFTNCKFRKSGYNVVAAYRNTTFNNCEFDSTFNAYAQAQGFEWNFNNCKFAGEDLTTENFKASMVDSDVWNKCTCYLNETLIPADSE